MIPWVAALVAESAWACSCDPYTIVFVSPEPDATELPRNTVFRVYVLNTLLYGEWRVLEDGVEKAFEKTHRQFGPHDLLEIRPQEPYAPGSTVEILSDDTLLQTFTVGEELDETPPSWTGEFEVQSTIEEMGTCETYRHHDFTWSGLSDDRWANDDLLAVFEPLEEGMNPLVGYEGDIASIRHHLCVEDDPTLVKQFYRKYLVHFEDGAGNASEPFEVKTGRAGCGCASGLSSGLSGLFTWALAVLVCRRSRTP